jgi:uncharacterized coiled-coil protein SlyX
LIAEEVAKVNPSLGHVLLNEFLKEHSKVQEQDATIAQVKSTAAKHEATIAHQQSKLKRLLRAYRK